MEEGHAIKSNSVVTVETYPEIEWAERLIWAPLQVVGQARDDAVVATSSPVSLWWPAVRFESIVEFDRYHQHMTDKSYRTDLAVLMMNRVQLAEPVFCIEYLGRPLADVQVLEEKEFQPEYYGSLLAMVLGAMSCKPQFFADRLPQELVAITYQDFHRALDLTLPYLGQPETDTFVKNSQSSWQEWEEQQRPATATTADNNNNNNNNNEIAIPSGVGNGGRQRQSEVDSPVHPSKAPALRAVGGAVAPAGAAAVAASPNHSIAAVSVTDESMVSATSHLTPASTVVTTATDSSRDRPNDSAGLPTYEGWPRSMDPLGDIPWQEAHALLRMSGWTKYVDHDNQIMYHYQAQGPALTLSSMQTLAKQRYGWKPPAAQTPSPSRQSRRRAVSQPPSTNARNYSFGFVWTHKLAPEGWKKVLPKGPDAKLVDYYYLRPHVSPSQLGNYRKGHDYFDDHWVVLDWCRENDYFRTFESSSSESESIASGVADDPSTYLESMEEHVDCEDDEEELEPNTSAPLVQQKSKTTKKKKRPKKKKSKASQKNFSFGVLWAIHLEPQGWTMPRAKGNTLIDYYYVRPGRSTNGVLGEDYFQSTDDVLDWCRFNNDYPPSSSPETNLKDGATSSIGDEDESTKHPAETEDDHTIGDQTEYSTPGTRTKPQDPSLPLLRDDDVDTEPLTEADRYDWKNLWPMLLKLGWKSRKSRNSLENWRFERPRRLNDESEEMILGKHYFTDAKDVIAHVKEMDRLEQAGVSSSDCEDVFNGRFVGHPNPTSKSSNILSSSDEEEPVRKMVARKKGATTTSKKYSKGMNTSDQKNQASKKRKESKDARPIWLKIDVDVDPLENTAPWATNPVPKDDLHHIVTKTGCMQYTSGMQYYLRDDPSVRFGDITEVFKHNARLGSGNYAIAADVEPEEKALFVRLVDYAFCTGSDFDRRQTRQLNQVEIEACLWEILRFEKKADGCWYDCLGSARTKSCSKEKTLKSSYDSLPQLLRDLRGIENLEGTSNVRKRTPLGMDAEEFKKKKRLIMAFRLSIADDAVVDNLNGTLSQASHPNPPRKKRATGTKSIASSKAAPTKSSGEKSHSDSSIDELNFEKQCERDDHDGGKIGSKRSLPSLCKSESAKKRDMKEAEAQRIENCIKENTFKVFNDSSQPHGAILALGENPDRKWTVAKELGAIYQGGYYQLPDRYGMNYSNNPLRECTSTDELFRHLGTFGGYDVRNVEEIHREAAKLEIACANVPGRRSEWKNYRMIEEHEGVLLLNMLGFERPTRGCPEWIVPDRLLAYRNRYVEGNPPLLKKKYANTDDLRIALRRIPDLQHQPGETRRRASNLTQDIMIVLRLWIASGPVGPDCVSYSAQAPNTELPSEASTMVDDNTGPSSLPSSPGSQSLATQDQEILPSPTRREDLFTQPEESENDDVGLQEAIAGFVNTTPDKPELHVEFESPNHGLLTQAPADEDLAHGEQ